ncbi:MAG: FAD-dependent monooxygenase [Balneolaceae bacterium]|nr:FAD-dependent monooxygenase [Balneolaceae bacterium]
MKWLRPFYVEQFWSTKTPGQAHSTKSCVYLAGDSAHVVSPIGGQGMNLGWLDSWELANRIEKLFSGNESYSLTAEQYTASRARVAEKVIRRAEINMALGRKSYLHPAKTKLVWLMLNTPLEKLMAQVFTMRGLKSWPI